MNKKLSTFTLVMINVIAIDSLRSVPIGAGYGFSVVFFYTLAALTFFIPSALVAAELASAWPEEGGLYRWVKDGFGTRLGFVVIFLQWIYNICWYPTILALFAATIGYLFYPPLVQNKFFMVTCILIVFWLATWINSKGVHVSGTLSNITAIVGTLVPLILIAILGVVWLIKGNPSEIKFTSQELLPKMNKTDHWILFATIMYSLVGIEISAYHAKDVRNPQRDYPKSLLYSAIIILATLVTASLAVAIVMPHALLTQSLIDGLLAAFQHFFTSLGMTWMIPIIAICIAIGTLGGVGAWIIGPSKGVLIAAKDGCVPPFMCKTNRHGAPINILILQGIIFSALCLAYVFMPTVNSGFFILSNLTAQLALLGYLFMFGTLVILRYKHPHQHRPYRIPGNNLVSWAVALTGITACSITILLSFLPPENIQVGNKFVYEILLLSGFLGFLILPFIIYSLRRSSWIQDPEKK